MRCLVTVIPAYGRDYDDEDGVRSAWKRGKDFKIVDVSHPNRGAMINKQDADAAGISVKIRYRELTEIIVIKPARS